MVEVWVTGEGFLKQMVRNIVGTLVEIGLGKIASNSVPSILAAQDRTAAGPTAPAHGLTLLSAVHTTAGTNQNEDE